MEPARPDAEVRREPRRRRRRRFNATPYLFVAAGAARVRAVRVRAARRTRPGCRSTSGTASPSARSSASTTTATCSSDQQVRSAFWHSLVLVLFYAGIPTVLGLIVAAFLARSVRRGMTAYRTLIFLPQAIATVVTAVAWKWIYHDDGPISSGLRAVGLGSLAPDAGWLGEPEPGAHRDRPRRRLDHDRPLRRAVHGRRAVDRPARCTTPRASTGRDGPRVLRRDAARPQGRDRLRARDHRDRGAALVRPRLRDDGRRPEQRHQGAGRLPVPARLPERRGRRRLRGGR